MMYEKIDALRSLLELSDRDVASFVTLEGIAETHESDTIRTYAKTGDVAFVFVGPKDKLPATLTRDEDGSLTFTVKVER